MAAEVVLDEVKAFGLAVQEDEETAVAEKRELQKRVGAGSAGVRDLSRPDCGKEWPCKPGSVKADPSPSPSYLFSAHCNVCSK